MKTKKMEKLSLDPKNKRLSFGYAQIIAGLIDLFFYLFSISLRSQEQPLTSISIHEI